MGLVQSFMDWIPTNKKYTLRFTFSASIRIPDGRGVTPFYCSSPTPLPYNDQSYEINLIFSQDE